MKRYIKSSANLTNDEFHQAMQDLGDYWNRPYDDTNYKAEYNHPWVGRQVKVIDKSEPVLYGQVYTIVRAYDDSSGVTVRCELPSGGVLTLHPEDYKLLPVENYNK